MAVAIGQAKRIRETQMAGEHLRQTRDARPLKSVSYSFWHHTDNGKDSTKVVRTHPI